ncbi:MAG: hypothetical protein JW837_15540 [Sedimentisphaerales bacterium]|nr:hypothetical protein [Sedimentisphaerales bacterium]
MKIRLIDVVFLSVALFAGIECGRWVGSTYGIIGHIAGFVLGAIAALTFLFSFIYFLGFVLNLCRPHLPVCKENKYSRGHYTYIQSLDNGAGDVFSCKCNRKYIMKRDKGFHYYKEVLELLDDGTTRPYMIYVKRFIIFGRWEKASSEVQERDQ